MKIGDKVRFLNDVGGGKITAFRSGGIVLVEDADGFEVPIPQNEVVVLDEKKGGDVRKEKEVLSLNGKEYLKSKTVAPAEPVEEMDENMEARIVRLEQALQKQILTSQQQEQMIQQQILTIQKLETRVALLEAENNLRKNEKSLVRSAKPRKKPESPTNIDGLQIL